MCIRDRFSCLRRKERYNHYSIQISLQYFFLIFYFSYTSLSLLYTSTEVFCGCARNTRFDSAFPLSQTGPVEPSNVLMVVVTHPRSGIGL